MEKVYTVLAISTDYGELDGKKWEGARLICHEKSQIDGKTVTALTRVFKCQSTLKKPAVGSTCYLYFDERGRVAKVE